MSEQEQNPIAIQDLPTPEGTFWPVAALAISQGFDITAVKPTLKRPRPYEWQKNPITNLVDANFYAFCGRVMTTRLQAQAGKPVPPAGGQQ
jgi:hypothetical protein